MLLNKSRFSRKIARHSDHSYEEQLLFLAVSHMMSKVRSSRGGQYWRGILGDVSGVWVIFECGSSSDGLLYPKVRRH